MPTVKRLACLANSRKLSGRCIAGKELIEGKPVRWIRPVSDRPQGEVSEDERQYEDGSDPSVLDVIDVPLKEHRPHTYQSENWLLDPDKYWRRVKGMNWKDLASLVDDPPCLWVNESSTFTGLNDRVPTTQAEKLTESLYFLYVKSHKVRVLAPGAAFGNVKRRVQAAFTYRGVEYRLWVTDPVVERRYLALTDGEYPLDECFLTVSLGEPHDGYCYKLVAALITADLTAGARP